jgi:nucleoid-associated protein YgaU
LIGELYAPTTYDPEVIQEKENVMGLFDFIKDAGEMIFGPGKEAPAADANTEAAASAALAKSVGDLGIPVQNLSVQLKGDVATITGTAKSQADREKAILAIGNTKGIAQVDDRIAVETPEPEAKFYTVQRGDTLSKIAREHYGDASKYPTIFEANRPMLKDPDKIYPGQKLRIPPQ